jgi:hypothetical protein
MKELKGAGNRHPEPATMTDARLPEQWDWPLEQALRKSGNETEDSANGSDPAVGRTEGLAKYASRVTNSCFLLGAENE